MLGMPGGTTGDRNTDYRGGFQEVLLGGLGDRLLLTRRGESRRSAVIHCPVESRYAPLERGDGGVREGAMTEGLMWEVVFRSSIDRPALEITIKTPTLHTRFYSIGAPPHRPPARAEGGRTHTSMAAYVTAQPVHDAA